MNKDLRYVYTAVKNDGMNIFSFKNNRTGLRVSSD